MKKKIVLITDFFPYSETAETFLETEIRYWAMQKNVELIILPMNSDQYIRDVPKNIVVDNSLNRYLKSREKNMENDIYKILNVLKVLYKKKFWKELIRYTKFEKGLIKELLLSLRKLENYSKFFKEYKEENKVDIYYTYWFTEATYALQELRRDRDKLITRVHGFDLYENRTLKNYMPLRREFIDNIDRVFTITDSAINYLINVYGFNRNSIETSRLGVENNEIITKASPKEMFHIVSCSRVLAIKQIDKIVDLLVLLSEKHRNINFIWTHLGDGSLFDSIQNYALNKLGNKNNVKYDLKGSLSNNKIFEFYKENEIDVFLNVSSSEGVPVSIMEAMSCHIPIVAPDIGGISDMIIDGYNGKLLSPDFQINELVAAFQYLMFFKDKRIRTNAYNIFLDKYYSKKNYLDFIEKVMEMK